MIKGKGVQEVWIQLNTEEDNLERSQLMVANIYQTLGSKSLMATLKNILVFSHKPVNKYMYIIIINNLRIQKSK